MMTQVFKYGFYNADPNGGNFHSMREEGKLKVVLIDCGSAERVRAKDFDPMIESICWLKLNPSAQIPKQYLYASIFFKRMGYLYAALEPDEVLRIIYKKRGDPEPAKRAAIAIGELRKKFLTRWAREKGAGWTKFFWGGEKIETSL